MQGTGKEMILNKQNKQRFFVLTVNGRELMLLLLAGLELSFYSSVNDNNDNDNNNKQKEK